MALTLDQAASQASQLTGLPVALTRALIQAEGSLGGGDWQNGEIVNNPFDVTSTWAQLAGYGQYVTGQGGSQGNIASFDTPEHAVQAWAAGIKNFSNYAGVRSALAAGGPIGSIVQAFAGTGYAGPGDVSGWVNNVLGLAGAAANGGQTSTQTSSQTSGPLAGAQEHVGSSLGITLPPINIPGAAGIPDAITKAAQGAVDAVQQAASPITNFFGTVNKMVTLLGQPKLWLALVMLFIGAFLLVVGLVFLGVSFLPRSVKQDAVKVLKVAPAVAA